MVQNIKHAFVLWVIKYWSIEDLFPFKHHFKHNNLNTGTQWFSLFFFFLKWGWKLPQKHLDSYKKPKATSVLFNFIHDHKKLYPPSQRSFYFHVFTVGSCFLIKITINSISVLNSLGLHFLLETNFGVLPQFCCVHSLSDFYRLL